MSRHVSVERSALEVVARLAAPVTELESAALDAVNESLAANHRKVTLYYDPICHTFSTENEPLDCHDEEPFYGIPVVVEVEVPEGEPNGLG